MQSLIDNIEKRIRLSNDLKKVVEDRFQKTTIAKGALLLKEFQYCKKLYFLKKGTIRSFYYDKEKEVTSWFYIEGQFCSAWYSFYSQQPSFENIEAAEDCEICWIDYHAYQKLLVEYPIFEKFGRLLAEEQTSFIDYFSKGFLFMSAKEKYDLLQSYYPDITLRVNLGHIASFLGISQETLSRIRKQKVKSS